MLYEFNWSINVIAGLSAVAFAYIPSMVIMLVLYAKSKARHALLWALINILLAGYNLSSVLGSIFSIDYLGVVGTIFVLSSSFFLVLFVDSVNRDSVDPLKLSVISVLWGMTTLGLVISLNAPVFQALIEDNFVVYIVFGGCAAVLLFVPGFLVLYHGVRMLKHVPATLKFYARLFLIGGIFIVFASLFSVFDVSITFDPVMGGLNLSGILMIVAILSITVALARQPELAYVLPFKALRLMVVDTCSGIPIFTHTWGSSEDQFDDSLFSGMLQGISLLLKETLDRGNLREITMDEGIMILQRSQTTHIACVLVATRSSHTLRDGLRLFSEKFYAQFKEHLADAHELSRFKPASKIVADCFPFLPE